MANCPLCKENYENDYYKRTGKCSECGKVIRKYVEGDELPANENNNAVRRQAKAAAKKESDKNTEPRTDSKPHYGMVQNKPTGYTLKVSGDKALKGENKKKTTFQNVQDKPNAKVKNTDTAVSSSAANEDENIDIDTVSSDISNDDAMVENQKLLERLKEVAKKTDDSTDNEQWNGDDELYYDENEDEITESDDEEDIEVETEEQKKARLDMERRKRVEEKLYSKKVIRPNEDSVKGKKEKSKSNDNKQTTDTKEESAGTWLKKKVANEHSEKMEIEGIDYESNRDGYYNDVPPLSPIKADTISKATVIKSFLVVIGLILLIAFMVFYA